jgi:hypothetical protein
MHFPRKNFMFHISGCYKSFKVPDFEEKNPYVIVRAPPVVRFLKKTFAITKYNIHLKPVHGSSPPLISYLFMKEGSLFCFCIVVMRSTELGCFRSCSWCLSKGGGVHWLGSMKFGLGVQKLLNIE